MRGRKGARTVAGHDAPPAHAKSPEGRFLAPDISFELVRPTCPVGGPQPTLPEILHESMPARYEEEPQQSVSSAVPRREREPARFRRKEWINRRSAGPLGIISMYPMVTNKEV